LPDPTPLTTEPQPTPLGDPTSGITLRPAKLPLSSSFVELTMDIGDDGITELDASATPLIDPGPASNAKSLAPAKPRVSTLLPTNPGVITTGVPDAAPEEDADGFEAPTLAIVAEGRVQGLTSKLLSWEAVSST